MKLYEKQNKKRNSASKKLQVSIALLTSNIHDKGN